LSGVFPLWSILVLFKSFSSFMSLYVPCYRPYTTNTTQTSMPPVRFEPTILASERPKTHALDRTATGIDKLVTMRNRICRTASSRQLSTGHRIVSELQ
jgi:hypothetical protein